MEDRLRRAAEAARGFMPPDEGLALYEAAASVEVDGPLLEVGSYCGKSAVYLGAAAQRTGRVLFCVDHHRGSEENQPGWEHHDPEVVDAQSGVIDTLPFFRRTIGDAGLEDTVVAVVGDSPKVASLWATPLALVFIDGGHGAGPAHRDYEGWSPHVAPGGLLAIHDVFEDPADGGRPPYEIWCRALAGGCFKEQAVAGSLRVLQRTAPDPA
ncbi:MAG: class I SAM-dependent methyltransferase [Acidimicrobiaceae bacterium]|nr:class I SAM-dependent methyltransferase [Acidimicrobiaceae bacterium]